MKTIIALLVLMGWTATETQYPNATELMKKVDANMVAKTEIIESTMIIHGKRSSRKITSKSYSEGSDKSFMEYLAPQREKGTKMLKLKDNLWIYSPLTDRVIQLSGHMLKQSLMGSDLSYEDMMEDREWSDVYQAKVTGEDTVDGRKTWVVELTAKVSDASYHKRKVWIDHQRYIPLKEQLYAKSGQLLKKTVLSDVSRVGNRWFPKKINYRDMLKNGKGTDFIVNSVQFDVKIPTYIFSKASLKK